MNYQVLYQWREKIASHLPSLNSWQQENVALFSQGIIKAENCQQQQIARQVACGNGWKVQLVGFDGSWRIEAWT